MFIHQARVRPMIVCSKFRYAYYMYTPQERNCPAARNIVVMMRGRKIAHRPRKTANYYRQNEP